MLGERSTIRTTMVALLVALVASFALSGPADAATKKPLRTRAKHSSRAAAAKPAVKKKAARKKTAKARTAKKSVRKSAAKRKPTTKPR